MAAAARGSGDAPHPGYLPCVQAEGAGVSVPPDGWCFYYCCVCWESPAEYLLLPRRATGHFLSPTDHRTMRERAGLLHRRVVRRLADVGESGSAARLSSDPQELWESDFEHFAAVLGCSLELADGAGGFHVYGSPRRVGLRLRRYQSRDEAGDMAWHYDILGLWTAPVPGATGERGASQALLS